MTITEFRAGLIPLESLIGSVDNPREVVEVDDDFVDSIRSVGILQNLLVRELPLPAAGEERVYEIIDGHRRYVGAMEAGLEAVPCTIDDPSDAVRLTDYIVANVHRKDLEPIEQARGIEAVRIQMDEEMPDEPITQRELAKVVGISQSQVSKLLKLLQPAKPKKAKVDPWNWVSAPTRKKVVAVQSYAKGAVSDLKRGNALDALQGFKLVVKELESLGFTKDEADPTEDTPVAIPEVEADQSAQDAFADAMANVGEKLDDLDTKGKVLTENDLDEYFDAAAHELDVESQEITPPPGGLLAALTGAKVDYHLVGGVVEIVCSVHGNIGSMSPMSAAMEWGTEHMETDHPESVGTVD